VGLEHGRTIPFSDISRLACCSGEVDFSPIKTLV